MLKRKNRRIKSCFIVVLYHDNDPIVVCCADNVCSEGVFIGTIHAINIPTDNLAIGFEYGFNGESKIFKLPVSICHHQKNGLGLKFKPRVKESDIFAHTVLGYISRTFECSDDLRIKKI